MSQEKKKKIAEKLKSVVPFGWKYSLRVHHHSMIIMTIKKGPKALLEYAPYRPKNCPGDAYDKRCYDDAVVRKYRDLNVYHLEAAYPENSEVVKDLRKILDVLNTDNHDRSDISTDYFDVGHYVSLKVGDHDKDLETTD